MLLGHGLFCGIRVHQKHHERAPETGTDEPRTSVRGRRGTSCTNNKVQDSPRTHLSTSHGQAIPGAHSAFDERNPAEGFERAAVAHAFVMCLFPLMQLQKL